jgi:phosphate-selective porin OprO and OprP
VLTGETHTYNPASASYGGIKPAHPFSLDGAAWEIAGRVSTIDLNNQLGPATGISGGRQTVYTAALNWYVNGNVRLMLNYLHGNLSRQSTPTSIGDVDSKFDAVAMRTHFAF